MAREDPPLVQLFDQFKNPERTILFLRHFHLLPPADVPIGFNRQGNPYLAECSTKRFNLEQPHCTGKIQKSMVKGKPVFRCTVCKNHKSIHYAASAYDPAVVSMDPKDVLYIIFCLVKGLPVSSLEFLIGRKFSPETSVEWSLKIREMVEQELSDAPKMGGVGDIVEVDENFMKGRRKANRGRLLQSNRSDHLGHMPNNYLRRSEGPWLFSMIVRSRECRLFWVPDRSAATLIPIIKANVLSGTTIYSDEWRAYYQVVQHGYGHLTVNHSQHFIDPITGCSTQIIERQWKKIKLPLLRQGLGVRERTLCSQLAQHWWNSSSVLPGNSHGCSLTFNPQILFFSLILLGIAKEGDPCNTNLDCAIGEVCNNQTLKTTANPRSR